MPISDDQVLWQRAREGNAEAFGDLYERHARAVQAFCLWRTADLQTAEDATATVFLEAWRNRGRLRVDGDSAAPLLLGIATNILRGHWRTRRRHRDALARIRGADEDGGTDLAGEAIARIDAERELREAGAAVRALPRHERDVLALIAWGGLSYEETATALGVAVGTVRSRLSRARARLAKELPATSPNSTEEAQV